MMRSKRLALCVLVAGVAVLAGGCPALTGLADLLPENVWYVLDNIVTFRDTADLAIESVEPGAVVDDLTELDGCWGAAYTGINDDTPIALVSVYQFDAEAGTFEAWTLPARRDGSLPLILGIVSKEEGPFEVTGENTIRLTLERMYSNVNDDGEVVSELVEVDLGEDDPFIDRNALITLDGDTMLFYIDCETVDDIPADEEMPVFLKFDCIAEE